MKSPTLIEPKLSKRRNKMTKLISFRKNKWHWLAFSSLTSSCVTHTTCFRVHINLSCTDYSITNLKCPVRAEAKLFKWTLQILNSTQMKRQPNNHRNGIHNCIPNQVKWNQHAVICETYKRLDYRMIVKPAYMLEKKVSCSAKISKRNWILNFYIYPPCMLTS